MLIFSYCDIHTFMQTKLEKESPGVNDPTVKVRGPRRVIDSMEKENINKLKKQRIECATCPVILCHAEQYRDEICIQARNNEAAATISEAPAASTAPQKEKWNSTKPKSRESIRFHTYKQRPRRQREKWSGSAISFPEFSVKGAIGRCHNPACCGPVTEEWAQMHDCLGCGCQRKEPEGQKGLNNRYGCFWFEPAAITFTTLDEADDDDSKLAKKTPAVQMAEILVAARRLSAEMGFDLCFVKIEDGPYSLYVKYPYTLYFVAGKHFNSKASVLAPIPATLEKMFGSKPYVVRLPGKNNAYAQPSEFVKGSCVRPEPEPESKNKKKKKKRKKKQKRESEKQN